MKYEEWEKSQGISPSSPEALYAEKAWNAALRSAKADMVARGLSYEAGVLDIHMTDDLA